MTLLVGSSDP